jgi:putative transposase
MKRKRFPAEQIVSILRQAELDMAVSDIVRQLGISEQTFYRWKKQYAGMQVEGVRGLKILQDENTRLKKLVAELSLDKAILQDVASKKWERPALKREVVVKYIMNHYGLKLARACRLMKQVRSTQYLHSRKDPKLPLRQRLKELGTGAPQVGVSSPARPSQARRFPVWRQSDLPLVSPRGAATAVLAQEARQPCRVRRACSRSRQRCLEYGFRG